VEKVSENFKYKHDHPGSNLYPVSAGVLITIVPELATVVVGFKTIETGLS
jgi:hypothetical protein